MTPFPYFPKVHDDLCLEEIQQGATMFYATPKPPLTPTSSGGPARPRTAVATTTPASTVRQEEEQQLPQQPWRQRGRWQLQGSRCQCPLALLQTLDRLYSDVVRSQGSRAAGATTTSSHDGGCTLLRLSASAGRACLCATRGATSCPPWAYAAVGPAAAWTSVEPVDWVLGPAVPHQLVQHHDIEPAHHHGLNHRLWRLQPYLRRRHGSPRTLLP
jgi:hypothetical protein